MQYYITCNREFNSRFRVAKRTYVNKQIRKAEKKAEEDRTQNNSRVFPNSEIFQKRLYGKNRWNKGQQW